MRRQLLWSGGVSTEASLGPAMASAPSLLPPAVSRLLGEQLQVKGQEVVGPAGHPSRLQHLHLAAVPHASLGMEVMEEMPEGETFHFQASLEDPEWGRGRMSGRSTGGNWALHL